MHTVRAPEAKLISLELGIDEVELANYGGFMARACDPRDFTHVISVQDGSERQIAPDVSLIRRYSANYMLPTGFADQLMGFIEKYDRERNCASFACRMAGVELVDDVTVVGAKLPEFKYERIGQHDRLSAGDVVRMIPEEYDAEPSAEIVDNEHWFVAANETDRTALHVLGNGAALYLMPVETIQRIYPERKLYVAEAHQDVHSAASLKEVASLL